MNHLGKDMLGGTKDNSSLNYGDDSKELNHKGKTC
jgi:hypothetical protein